MSYDTVNSIKDILIEQTEGYRVLLDVLQRERKCLLNLDTTGVEDLSKEKDTIILRLRLLEEERIRLIREFSTANSIVGDIGLQRLYEITQDNTFLILRLQLISLLQSIAELNEFNRILIERSLCFVKNSMSFLDSLGLELNRKGIGVILSKEV